MVSHLLQASNLHAEEIMAELEQHKPMDPKLYLPIDQLTPEELAIVERLYAKQIENQKARLESEKEKL